MLKRLLDWLLGRRDAEQRTRVIPTSQYLRCREPQCVARVLYKPEPVCRMEEYHPKDRIRVYLECDDGHTLEYIVWPYAPAMKV